MPSPPAEFQFVLSFWFSLRKPGKKDDVRVRSNLGESYHLARAGELDSWGAAHRPRLALIVLLDQVPRHLVRDRPEAYDTDREAQGLTSRFLHDGGWEGLAPLERYYAAIPWMHAEDIGLQERINPLIHELVREDSSLLPSAGIADLYLETIRRFGRFPHRNAILGRPGTTAEQAFLHREWRRRKRAVYRK